MHWDSDLEEALGGFVAEGWLSEVIDTIKQGKEATVYRCLGGPLAGGVPVAAKVYRANLTGRFQNDVTYLAGRKEFAHDSRIRRAITSGTRYGREVQAVLWLENEWETLCLLHAAGARVPAPLFRGSRAILMSLIGDERGAAPRLADIEADEAEAAALADEVLDEIELMLDCHRVHGDLSPYNVLHAGRRAVVIDFPQAVDPRLNPAASALLGRDVDRICRWAARFGVDRHAGRITADLWERFVEGALG